MPSGALLFEACMVSCRQCLVLLYMLCWLLKPLSSSQLPSACRQKTTKIHKERNCVGGSREAGESLPRGWQGGVFGPGMGPAIPGVAASRNAELLRELKEGHIIQVPWEVLG